MSPHEPFTLSSPVGPADHARGPAHAPVTIVEYGDFECPNCRQAVAVVKLLLGRFDNRVRFAYRHFPLEGVLPHAEMAAEAAECAGEQGKFWEMHDLLLDHQDELNPPALRRYADDLGLDADRFWEDVRTREFAPHIAEDVRTADESGVAGTPTFFINGRRHQGAYDVDTLNTAVRRAHNQARIRAAA